MSNSKALLLGMIPQPPYILVRDEGSAVMIQAALHKDWSRTPPVIVADDWPDDMETNAVVVTPLHVLGSEGVTSFSIVGDGQISENARKVLDACIRLKRAQGGGHISYRDIASATNLNRRTVSKALNELEKLNVGVRKQQYYFSLDIGRWLPDANKARALGVEIKEFT